MQNAGELSFCTSANEFGQQLLDAAATEDGFISPLSVVSALLLTANGSQGTTLTEIATALRWQRFESIAEVNRAASAILQRFEALRAARGCQVCIANSVWLTPKLQLNPTYVSSVSSNFGATASALTSGAQVNAWCAEKTAGRIEKILKEDDSPALALINAVYFKGSWQSKFHAPATVRMDFQSSQGPAPCHMMSVEGKFHYAHTAAYQAIRLPYESPDMFAPALDAVVVLRTLDRGGAAAAGWESVWRSLQGAEVQGSLRMPRFKVESSYDLKEHLQAMGVSQLFSQGSAELQPMLVAYPAVGLQVDKVIHKVFVEVNEEGTEAAAVTAVVATFGCAAPVGPPPFVMLCDRPFEFHICERGSGLRLFAGRVANPGLQGGSAAGTAGPAACPSMNPFSGPGGSAGAGPLQGSFFSGYYNSPSLPAQSKVAVKPSHLGEVLLSGAPPSLAAAGSLCLGPQLFEQVHQLGLSLLSQASEALSNLPPHPDAASTSACSTTLREAFHSFRLAADLHVSLHGVPSDTAFYNTGCCHSLAAELQLRAANSVQPFEVTSAWQRCSNMTLTPELSVIADLPPTPPVGSNVDGVLRTHLNACQKWLKLAVAAGYANMQHLKRDDRDLAVIRALGGLAEF